MFFITARLDQSYFGFLFLAIASSLMIYWVKEFKRLIIFQNSENTPAAFEEKNWIYDLIQGDHETVFVAEVPGPEDQIDVRLREGILYIKGGHNFAKDILLKSTSDMTISDCKYTNGVLTLRIQML
jgi:HSP20 family protein